MKKRMPLILSLILLVVALTATVMFDRLVDRDRLAEVSTIPDYAPTVSQTPDPTEETQPEGRKDAPNISFTDAEGNTLTLEQFRGKPVVINFWASWSGSSQRELAMFQEAYNDYKEQVHFLIINTTSDDRETREQADQMISDGGYTFPVYYDENASAANDFEVMTVPTTFFVDRNGKAIAYAAGELNRYNFERGLSLCYQNQESESTSPTEQTTPEE